ncbi:MAG TPA: hypothetical protein VHW60_02210 [Caulobacteraceae bacterium]|jgi:hypothetical protein|nr:hypothetical protein [Caulobacteraceae bacterium]
MFYFCSDVKSDRAALSVIASTGAQTGKSGRITAGDRCLHPARRFVGACEAGSGGREHGKPAPVLAQVAACARRNWLEGNSVTAPLV